MNANDQEQLKLLSIFHYVVGGLTALFSLFPIMHVVMGVAMIVAGDKMGGKGPPPPPFIGWMFALMGSAFIAAGMTLAGFILATGRLLAQRRRRLFCLIVAGVECMLMPFGTALGVFTIIVLSRDSVKAEFEAPR